MKIVSKLLVGLVLVVAMAGSVSAAEMTYQEALDALKAGEWNGDVSAALTEKTIEQRVSDIESFKTESYQAGRVYTAWLVVLPVEDKAQLDARIQEVRDVAEDVGFSPYKRLQTLLYLNPDIAGNALMEQILSESIDAGNVHWRWGVRLANQVESTELKVAAINQVADQYKNRADLLTKSDDFSGMFIDLKMDGALSDKEADAILTEVIAASSLRLRGMTNEKQASDDGKALESAIGSLKGLREDLGLN